MSVVDGSIDNSLKLEEKASAPLAGGIMGQGYQCGMLWGAALGAGAQAYRLLGPGSQAEAEALETAQRLVKAFRTCNQAINCGDIIQLDWRSSTQTQLMKQVIKFFLKGGPIKCFRMAANYAQVAYQEINESLPKLEIEVPTNPISCTALLARKMGLSDLHRILVAGFAGGIGLSGGACGALGVAIWALGMKSIDEGGNNIGLSPPGGEVALERFLEAAGYEFECSRIVGRRFENTADHADYLSKGGCSKFIEALVVQ
jgi:hypothetical protein